MKSGVMHGKNAVGVVCEIMPGEAMRGWEEEKGGRGGERITPHSNIYIAAE